MIWSKGVSVQKEGTNRGRGKYFEFKTSLTKQSTNFLKIIFSELVAGILNQGIKGQLISKGLFAILNSCKKRTKKFDFTTMIPQVELVSFKFCGRLEDTKKTFRN